MKGEKAKMKGNGSKATKLRMKGHEGSS